MWQQPAWQWLAGRALDLHDKNVIVAHWQRAVTFVGHSSRRVQRAVLISFVCRLCWHAAGLSFAVLSCNLRCSCDGRWQRYFPTALRWPDNGRHTCARSPYLTLPYGSRVLLRGDFGPSRCVCVSDSSDLELILSAPSVGTVGRVVWTARDLGQERPGGRRKVRLGPKRNGTPIRITRHRGLPPSQIWAPIRCSRETVTWVGERKACCVCLANHARRHSPRWP